MLAQLVPITNPTALKCAPRRSVSAQTWPSYGQFRFIHYYRTGHFPDALFKKIARTNKISTDLQLK